MNVEQPQRNDSSAQQPSSGGGDAAWRGLRGEVLRLALAVQFLTRVPLRQLPYSDRALNESARYFVVVGAFVGCIAAGVLAAAAWWLPRAVAVWLALAAALIATGAFHEDGLADTADALGAQGDRDRALAIMKDSRIGTYGALALVLTLGLKFAAVDALMAGGTAGAALALVVAHGLSRLAPVLLIASLPYAGCPQHARAKPLARRVSMASAVIALATAAGLLAVAAATAGAAAAAAAAAATAIVTVAIRQALQRWLGGFTGDALGATQQAAELAIYLAWLGVVTPR